MQARPPSLSLSFSPLSHSLLSSPRALCHLKSSSFRACVVTPTVPDHRPNDKIGPTSNTGEQRRASTNISPTACPGHTGGPLRWGHRPVSNRIRFQAPRASKQEDRRCPVSENPVQRPRTSARNLMGRNMRMNITRPRPDVCSSSRSGKVPIELGWNIQLQ